jgi:hypothetical protein
MTVSAPGHVLCAYIYMLSFCCRERGRGHAKRSRDPQEVPSLRITSTICTAASKDG